MRVIVVLTNGGRQESLDVQTVEIRDGNLVTERGGIPLDRIITAQVKP